MWAEVQDRMQTPWMSHKYTPDEIRAAVEAAEDWGTYVTAHVYNSAGVKRAIENGVKCIEHGNLMDETAMKLMEEKDVWLSPTGHRLHLSPKWIHRRSKGQARSGL